MKTEIDNRLFGLESIIHGMHHNSEMMEYMSYKLHKESFNLFNNLGLYWIWGTLMANQIIDFYKVIGKNENFSFIKIINVSNDLKCEINYELIDRKITELKNEYDKTDFETVRSKYLAHKDIKVPEIKTDLTSIRFFNEIFDRIRLLERMEALCFVTELKGGESVVISELTKANKTYA